MNNIIWQNDLIFIEVEEHFNPWLKIIVKRKVKEFSSCTTSEKQIIWHTLDIVEKQMLEYYQCDKVNIASFGNIFQQVHFHIMARFNEDEYFPNPVWGEKQRKLDLQLPNFDNFTKKLLKNLDNISNTDYN